MREGFDLEQVVTRGERPPSAPQNTKERIYEKLRMPLWLLDTILVALVLALVAALVIGALRGNMQ